MCVEKVRKSRHFESNDEREAPLKRLDSLIFSTHILIKLCKNQSIICIAQYLPVFYMYISFLTLDIYVTYFVMQKAGMYIKLLVCFPPLPITNGSNFHPQSHPSTHGRGVHPLIPPLRGNMSLNFHPTPSALRQCVTDVWLTNN